MSIVASKDGTIIYDPTALATGATSELARLIQIGKLTKIDNVHLDDISESRVRRRFRLSIPGPLSRLIGRYCIGE